MNTQNYECSSINVEISSTAIFCNLLQGDEEDERTDINKLIKYTCTHNSNRILRILYSFNIPDNDIYINYDKYMLNKIHSNIAKLEISINKTIHNLLNITFSHNNINIIKNFISLLLYISMREYTITINYNKNIDTLHIDKKILKNLKILFNYLIYTIFSDDTILHFIKSIDSIEINIIYQFMPSDYSIIIQVKPLIISIDM